MTEKRRILVTGGSGLVGKAVKQVLDSLPKDEDDDWLFLSSRDGDLRVIGDVEKLFSDYKPTHVLHLAARVGGLFDNMHRNLEFLRENIHINDNVLHASSRHKVKRVVSCLSTCIFPDKTSYPIDETMIHNGPPHPSNFGYSHAKRLIDIQNKAYQENGEKFTSIIPCNVFGPFDNFNLENSHVIPGLIHRLYLAKNCGQKAVIMGTGKPLRQFIYSLDLAKLILWALKEYDDCEPIILSVDPADEVSIKDVAELIAKNLKLAEPLTYNTAMADGQYKKTASNAKLRSYLPDFKFTPLETAVKETVDWFVENYKTARV